MRASVIVPRATKVVRLIQLKVIDVPVSARSIVILWFLTSTSWIVPVIGRPRIVKAEAGGAQLTRKMSMRTVNRGGVFMALGSGWRSSLPKIRPQGCNCPHPSRHLMALGTTAVLRHFDGSGMRTEQGAYGRGSRPVYSQAQIVHAGHLVRFRLGRLAGGKAQHCGSH